MLEVPPIEVLAPPELAVLPVPPVVACEAPPVEVAVLFACVLAPALLFICPPLASGCGDAGCEHAANKLMEQMNRGANRMFTVCHRRAQLTVAAHVRLRDRRCRFLEKFNLSRNSARI
jgi:hypothetical protein